MAPGITLTSRDPVGVVLAADTVVTIEDSILGKPRDSAEAGDMPSARDASRHAIFENCTGPSPVSG